MMMVLSILGAFGYLIVPGMARFQMSAAEFLLAFTLSALAAAAGFPVAGKLMARVGVKTVVIVAAVVMIVSMVLLSVVTSSALFYLLFVTFGFGSAGAGILTSSTLMTGWYAPGSRGRAIGIVSVGAGVGGIMWGFVMPTVILAWGWSGAFLTLGAFLVIAALLPGLLLISNPPLGIADGDAAEGTKKPRIRLRGVLLLTIFLLSLSGFLFSTESTFAQLQPAIYASKGIDPVLAGELNSALAFASIILGPLMGFLHDRFGVRVLLIILGISFAVGLPGVLILASVNPVSVFFIVPLIGFAVNTTPVAVPLVSGHVLGAERFASVYGFVIMGGYVGAALGAPVWGLVFDRTGSYDLAMYFAAGIALVGVILLGSIYSRRRKIAAAIDITDSPSMVGQVEPADA